MNCLNGSHEFPKKATCVSLEATRKADCIPAQGTIVSPMAVPAFVVCPVCHGALDEALVCTSCGRAYGEQDGILRLLDPHAPGIAAKLRELAAWPELAREQGWYEADDRIDAALPFLNRDLGWDDRAWAGTEHGFQLLLDYYVRRGDRVLEIGAAKSWASQHLLPRGCEYVACDLVVDPLIRARTRRVLRGSRRGPISRVQADGERLPFAGGTLRRRVLRRDPASRPRPRRDGKRTRAGHPPGRHRRCAQRGRRERPTGAA